MKSPLFLNPAYRIHTVRLGNLIQKQNKIPLAPTPLEFHRDSNGRLAETGEIPPDDVYPPTSLPSSPSVYPNDHFLMDPAISPSLQPYHLSLTHPLLVRTNMYTSPVSTWLLTNTLLRGRRTNRIKQGDLMKIRRNQRDEDRDTVWVCKLWPGR